MSARIDERLSVSSATDRAIARELVRAINNKRIRNMFGVCA